VKLGEHIANAFYAGAGVRHHDVDPLASPARTDELLRQADEFIRGRTADVVIVDDPTLGPAGDWRITSMPFIPIKEP
jgi:hypothetical protein